MGRNRQGLGSAHRIELCCDRGGVPVRRSWEAGVLNTAKGLKDSKGGALSEVSRSIDYRGKERTRALEHQKEKTRREEDEDIRSQPGGQAHHSCDSDCPAVKKRAGYTRVTRKGGKRKKVVSLWA